MMKKRFGDQIQKHYMALSGVVDARVRSRVDTSLEPLVNSVNHVQGALWLELQAVQQRAENARGQQIEQSSGE
jgi:hypothetical protein